MVPTALPAFVLCSVLGHPKRCEMVSSCHILSHFPRIVGQSIFFFVDSCVFPPLVCLLWRKGLRNSLTTTEMNYLFVCCSPYDGVIAPGKWFKALWYMQVMRVGVLSSTSPLPTWARNDPTQHCQERAISHREERYRHVNTSVLAPKQKSVQQKDLKLCV